MTSTLQNLIRPFPARVAYLVDPYRVVINRGSMNGIKMGNEFVIYGFGVPITDPETRQVLEQLELVRGHAKVIHLQASIATLITTETRQEPVLEYNVGSGTPSSRPKTVLIPFRNVQVGDFARPLDHSK
jgi:hypothetical protein